MKGGKIMKRVYLAIDLKSFYASVECVERKLDPLRTNLVVADASRTEKTICLAVSPSLKAHGISGRARLFEVVAKVKEVNRERWEKAVRLHCLQKDENGEYQFASSSFHAPALEQDPSLKLSYITAPPRMKLYEQYSTDIYSIYLKYIAPEDIHVYSIDEVFIDVSRYLQTYHMSPHELAMTMIREVLYTTGITATAGIGSNLYLAKIAMDIVAKHIQPDKDGVRVAELNEMSYRRILWAHQPLTDFWRVGKGYFRKLTAMGLYTMGDIARASLSAKGEDMLYQAFGVNAELLIDHAWGYEPVTIEDIKAFRPGSNSLSSGQVLKEPYTFDKGELIVKEMTELLVHDLVRKGVVTRQLVLTIGYDRTSIAPVIPDKNISSAVYKITATGKIYKGKVSTDPYSRVQPYHAHGTANLPHYSNSVRRIITVVSELYERIANKDLLIRRINIAACALLPEDTVFEDAPEQLDFFTDYTEKERQQQEEKKRDEKERAMLRAMLSMQDKYGKNAVLRGMNLLKDGTTIERNGQVGGHKAE